MKALLPLLICTFVKAQVSYTLIDSSNDYITKKAKFTNLNAWYFVSEKKQTAVQKEGSEKLILYPNPNNGEFRANGSVELFNLLGELVLKSSTGIVETDLKGIFIARIYNNKTSTYWRVVIY